MKNKKTRRVIAQALLVLTILLQSGGVSLFGFVQVPVQEAKAGVDQWRQLSLSGNGPTWTDIHCVDLGSKIACMNRAASSPTGALKIIDLTNPLSPTVTTADLPTPVSAAFGRPLAIGGDSNTLIVAGGSQTATTRNTNTGGWLAHTSLSSISWSLDYDNATAEYQHFGNITQFGTPSTWTSGRYYRPSTGVDYIYVQNYNLSPLTQGAFAYYNYGDANTVGGEAQGVAVSNNLFVIAYITNQGATGSFLHFMAVNGSVSTLYTPGTGGTAQSWTQLATMRPAFAYNNAAFFLTRSDSSNYTAVARATSAAVSSNAGSPITGDLRSGVDWDPTGSLRGAWAWLTTGAAYRATTTATFSTSSTYDISSGILNGATVRQVVGGYTGGIDVDGDGTSTDNIVAVLSDGNLAYWGDSLNTAPNSPTINNYNNAAYIATNTPALNFDISDPDAGTTVKYQVQIDNNSDFGSPEVDYTEPSGATTPRTGVTYTPSALADGSYYWRVRSIDASAAQSAWTTANSGGIGFRVDTTAPSSPSVSINGGAGYTTTTSTTLTLSATDSGSGNYLVMASENSDFTGASWQAYSTNISFSLSSGDGTKTVYAKIQDLVGNTSSSTSDTIVYDATAPTSTSISINSGDAATNSTAVTLTLAASDATSGMYEMMVSESATFVGASWEAYATSKAFTLSAIEGTKTVYAKFMDNAGNVTSSVSDTIIYDTTGPISGSVVINSGDSYTTSLSSTLALSSSDPGSGNSQMIISENSDFSGASWEAYATSKAFTLSAGDGTKTVYAKFRDVAQNESSATSDSIVYDATAPTDPTIVINSDNTNTNSAAVTLTLTSSDATSGLYQMMLSENADFSGGVWQSSASSAPFTLSGGDGTKTVYVQFKDNAGNVSNAASDSILLDTTVPFPTSVTINNDDAYTTSLSVTLDLYANELGSGISDMMLSESPTFVGASWEPFSTSAAFTLSSGDGTKTVYAKFRDLADNESVPVSDSITYDATAPTGSVTINGGATYTNSRSTTLTISALDSTSGMYQMQVSEDASFTGASWESYATSKAFTLAASDGTRTVYIRFKDNAGNVSGAYNDTIVLDRSGPIVTDFNINSDATYATSVNVTLTIGAIDLTSSVADMMISENSLFTGASWESYATSKSFTLSSDEGIKTVYIKFRDAAGNSSLPTFDTITLDTTLPDGSIVINSGDGYTQSQSVTLALSASDNMTVSQMRISENSDFTGASWEAYATSKAFTLSAGDGTKTVYVEYQDDAGNSSTPVSDAITFDATAPATNSVAINTGNSYTASPSVTLAISSTDATSGTTHMQVSESATFVGASWEAYATGKSFTLSSGDGSKTVYARFKDAAGNISTGVSDSIVLDTANPSGTVTINSGDALTAVRNVTLTISASDTTSGVSEMEISESPTFVGASYESYATSKSFMLSAGDGTKTVYIRFKDAAGNVSVASSDTIDYDSTAPTSVAIVINSNASYTNTTSVSLAISATDSGSGIYQMMISNAADFSGASWESYATSKLWTLASTDGAKTVYIKLRDTSLNVSETASDTIILDTAVPTGGVIINSGDAITNTRNVSLDLSATDTGSGLAQMMVSENVSFSGASWESYASAKSFTLTATDGTKTVYAKFKDNAGNISTAYSDTITQDTTGPTSISIKINNGAAATTSRNATLKLAATDAISTVAYMMISPSNTFADESWQVFASDALYTLSTGDGTKTLYAKFKDSLGNVSAVTSASIIYDTTAPTGSISINAGASVTSSLTVTLSLAASDASGSGVVSMQVSSDPTLSDASVIPYATSKSFAISSGDGTKTVYVRYIDAVGNQSTIYSDSISYKTPKTQSDDGSGTGSGSGSGSGSTDGGSTNGGGSTGGNTSGGSTDGNSGNGSGSGTDQGTVTVEIKIIDKENKPVPNAEVILENGTKGVTNKEGVVVFEKVPEGTKNVKVQYGDKIEEKQITISKENSTVSVKVGWTLAKGLEMAKVAGIAVVGMGVLGGLTFLVARKLRRKKFPR